MTEGHQSQFIYRAACCVLAWLLLAALPAPPSSAIDSVIEDGKIGVSNEEVDQSTSGNNVPSLSATDRGGSLHGTPAQALDRWVTRSRKTTEWGGNNCTGVAGGPQNCIASTAACTTGTNYSIDAGGVAVPRVTANSRTRAEGEVTMESVTTARPAAGCACGSG